MFVAVKWFRTAAKRTLAGYLKEVEMWQEHHNILLLHGYCENPVVLVYEYMNEGSL